MKLSAFAAQTLVEAGQLEIDSLDTHSRFDTMSLLRYASKRVASRVERL